MKSGIHLCESNVSLSPQCFIASVRKKKKEIHTAYTVSDAILGHLTDRRAVHPNDLSKHDYFTTPCLNFTPFTDSTCSRCKVLHGRFKEHFLNASVITGSEEGQTS